MSDLRCSSHRSSGVIAGITERWQNPECSVMAPPWWAMPAVLWQVHAHIQDTVCQLPRLHCRYHQLTRANDHLSCQLKEAHEALYEVQTAVLATPVHKQREQQHLLSCLHDAEQVGQVTWARLSRTYVCTVLGCFCVKC